MAIYLILYNNKNINMFNIYVVHDMYMFNIPSAKLSHMHITPNHVV